MIIRDNFFISLHKNIRYDPSSEPSQGDSSYEGSQHVVAMRNKKNYHQMLPSECAVFAIIWSCIL